ncbi:hypothetical protein CHH55_17435 [Niallia circulans]|nr:hypothetical protein [Niallia circulans]MDR4316376.1 hypothetical protein [Niallia circulans]MED3838454.1 hypothetical protein [Niallia circulans]MED4243927.1 hypothetical protein [Niallia circulans]MED4246321.1 hypothetical protein [Niallia circulans]MED5098917.1 hypothetical protein [Niallia circulans]
MYFQPFYSYCGHHSFLPHHRMISSQIGGESRITPPSNGGGTVPHLPPIGGGILPPFPGGEQPPPPAGPPAFPDAPQIGDGTDSGPPISPPPSFTPQLNQSQLSTFTVESSSIRPCMYRFTFIWLENGKGFWFYPTFIGRHSIAGYRWRINRWMYYGTDINRIRFFQCI